MTTDSNTRWWLAVDGKPEGPHSYAYVLAALQSGQVSPDALACPDGAQDWQPLKSYSEFASRPNATIPPSPDVAGRARASVAPQAEDMTDAGVMPQMYNWICTYSLFVVPIYWLASHLTCCLYQPTFHEESGFFNVEILMLVLDELGSFVFAVLFAFAGWKLRALRRSGVSLFQIAFWSNLGFNVFYFLSDVVLYAIASASLIDHFAPEADTAVITILVFVAALLIASGMFAFEVVAMIWLHRNRSRLPLTTAA